MVSGKRGCTHWGRLRWLGARSGSGEVGSAVGFGDVPRKGLFFFSVDTPPLHESSFSVQPFIGCMCLPQRLGLEI